LFEKLEAPWRDTHNADPDAKKERILTILTELTVTKNTPDLRTLVTTHQSWAKNNLPVRKNLAHSSDRRGANAAAPVATKNNSRMTETTVNVWGQE
jgi:hypothetical protein